jgi:hypothetical protein
VTERCDWRVRATLNKEQILADLAHLVALLRMPKLYCVVSATDEEDAIGEAEHHMAVVMGVPKKYITAFKPRRAEKR